MDILNTGETLAHHHKHANIGSYPLGSTDHTAIYLEIGQYVGKNKQKNVDGDLLAELAEEGLAGGIFVEKVLPHAENSVDDDGDSYPLGKLPVLIEIMSDVGHYREWHGNDRYHW